MKKKANLLLTTPCSASTSIVLLLDVGWNACLTARHSCRNIGLWQK